MSPRRDFLTHPEAWTRAGRRMTDRSDWAGIERDPRLSGNHWLDWVLLAGMVIGLVVMVTESLL